MLITCPNCGHQLDIDEDRDDTVEFPCPICLADMMSASEFPTRRSRPQHDQAVADQPARGATTTEATAPKSVSELSQRLVASDILAQRELDEFLETPSGWRAANGPHAFTNGLVKEGLLTPWQSDELWTGGIEKLRLDRYVLLDHLSEGGFGLIYRARHVYMERVVALKVLRQAVAKDKETMVRFRREGTVSGKLDHPNLLRAYDVFQVEESLVLVLEFVNGPDLNELVARAGPLPVAVACDCARQAFRGLGHIHRHRMVHRDIKPSNLLLAPRSLEEVGSGSSDASWGDVKVLDMGLVRLIHESAEQDGPDTLGEAPKRVPEPDDHEEHTAHLGFADDPSSLATSGWAAESTPHVTELGAVLGTLEFMAPEQAADTRSVDDRADLYSMGATLYFLLTGRPPLGQFGSISKRLGRLASEVPPSVIELRDECPSELCDLIAQLLAKKPSDRPASADEVADALTPFAGPQ